jgi:hypothetical protein
VLAPELLHTLFEYLAHFLEKRFGEFPIVLRAQFASSGERDPELLDQRRIERLSWLAARASQCAQERLDEG